MKFRWRSLLRWIGCYWGGRVEQVPPPPIVPEETPRPHSPRYRALVVPTQQVTARRPKGQSMTQRYAQKRRARVQALRP